MLLRNLSSNLMERGHRKIRAKRPGVLENFNDEMEGL